MNLKIDKAKIKYITKEDFFNLNKSHNNDYTNRRCYFFPDNANITIIHIIITRFLIEFYHSYGFPKKLYEDGYISNGIRVMKKYLLTSLENQSCKDFIWILMIGNRINISYIESLFNSNFNLSFQYKIIYKKQLKNYIRKKTYGIDVLITTRIDYDDMIYYDAVNDVRKAINIEKPMLLYGYNRGFYYYEFNKKYYDYFYNFKNQGAMSIFISLIIVLKKVNDSYNIYEIGDHRYIRETIIKNFKSYGIKKLNYEPAIFDSGVQKFVWVRQNYSGYYKKTLKRQPFLKSKYLNLNLFYNKIRNIL